MKKIQFIKNRGALFLAALLAFACTSLLAEEGGASTAAGKLLRQKLTADRAAQIALLNNGSFRATLEQIGISEADLREAGMLKNPSFSLSVRFPDRPPSATDAEEGVVFDFLDLFLVPLRKRVAAAQLEQTKMRVEDEALSLIAETKIAFYELQAQVALAGRLKLALDANEAAAELAQKQHYAGNINDLTLATQQAVMGQARLEVMMADAEVRGKREKLNRLMGASKWEAAEGLPEVPATDFSAGNLEALAVERRPDLAAAHAQLASVVQALGLTKKYRFVGALEFGIDTEHNPDHSNVTGPTMRLEVPIFNQGQARIAKGEAQLRQAEHRYEALALDIRSEVRERRDMLMERRDAARLYHDELLPGQDRIVKLTQLQYNGMLSGLYTLLMAKQNELATERGSIEATRDYWIARAELERAVGGNLDGKKTIPAAGKVIATSDGTITTAKTQKSSTNPKH